MPDRPTSGGVRPALNALQDGLRPEQQVMLACIRRAFGQAWTCAPDLVVDWERFAREVDDQGLAAVVEVGLDGDDTAVPGAIRAHLRAGRARALLRHKIELEPALRLSIETLASVGVEPIILKGTALAYLAYPDPAWREMSDIDLLVAPDQIARADQAMREAGFTAADVVRPDGHHHGPPLRTPDGRSIIELHFALFPADSPYAVELAELVARARPREVAGRPVRALAPADALLHTCAHLAFGHRYRWFPLRTLVDLLALANAAEVDWDAFGEMVRRTRTAGAVYWPLRLSRDWLGAPVPPGLLAELAPPAPIRRLIEVVLASPYVLDGVAPPGAGTEVLYGALRDLSLYGGCPISAQVGAFTRCLFPRPADVGHLPSDVTDSPARYAAHLARPARLSRGVLAAGGLVAQAVGRRGNSPPPRPAATALPMNPLPSLAASAADVRMA